MQPVDNAALSPSGWVRIVEVPQVWASLISIQKLLVFSCSVSVLFPDVGVSDEMFYERDTIPH